MATKMNPLASFVYDPVKITSVHFETQREHEVVRLILRRDAITNFPWVLMVCAATIIPIIVFKTLPQLPDSIPSSHIIDMFPPGEWHIVALLYGLAVYYFAFVNFSNWFYNILFVTNLRVVDVNYRAPFHTQTTQAQLQEVQDVRYTQGGLFGIAFNYGNIFIQTAGTKQNIQLTRVPNPNIVQERIVQLLP